MRQASPEESRSAIVVSLLVLNRVINEPAGHRLSGEECKAVRNECYDCSHAREVSGNAHIRCVRPDAGMRGDRHGIERGWFMYPLLFDPTWKAKRCSNFERAESAVSGAVSGAVSEQTNGHTS